MKDLERILRLSKDHNSEGPLGFVGFIIVLTFLLGLGAGYWLFYSKPLVYSEEFVALMTNPAKFQSDTYEVQALIGKKQSLNLEVTSLAEKLQKKNEELSEVETALSLKKKQIFDTQYLHSQAFKDEVLKIEGDYQSKLDSEKQQAFEDGYRQGHGEGVDDGVVTTLGVQYLLGN